MAWYVRLLALSVLLLIPARGFCAATIQWASADTPLDLTRNSVGKAQILSISATATTTAEVRLIDLESTSQVPLTKLVEWEPARLTIQPLMSGTVSIHPKAGVTPSPGLYSGQLIVSEGAGGILRKSVLLSVPNTPRFAPQSWKTEVYLFSPWPYPDRGRVFPISLAYSKTVPPIRDGQILGYLTSVRGDTVAVTRDSSQEKSGLPAGLSGLGLGFKGLDHVGIYTGTLDLPQGKVVALSLTVAHHILWPILVAAFGIFIGLLVQRYTTVLRVVWGLEQREAELGALFQQESQQFVQAAQGQSFSSYSVKTNFENKRDQVRSQIYALKGLVVTQLDENNPSYKAVADQLQQLEDQARAFGAAADRFKALEDSVAVINLSVRPPFLPQEQQAEPAFLVQARQLLPGTELTLEDFQARLTAVAASNRLVQGWPDLNSHAARLWKESGELAQSLKDPAAVAIAQAQNQTLGGIWTRLWIATDYQLPQTHQDLETAEEALLPLRPALVIPGGPQALPVAKLKAVLSPEVIRATIQSQVTPDQQVSQDQVPQDDRARASFYRSLRRRAEWALLALAFFIALYQGLKSYFGQPFGTLKDYLDLIFWAVITKGVLDLVVAGLQRLQNLRLSAGPRT